jgi:hypothetical protein
MAHSYFRGHEIEFVGEVWRYVDTKEPTPLSQFSRRSCGRCGEVPTPEGHDACFGTLPGVKNACCGHGQPGEAYVQFWDGTRLAGQEAIDFAKGLA